MIKRITFQEPFGIGSEDRFVDSQQEGPVGSQILKEQVEYFVLQFVIEVDYYIPADYHVELHLEEIWILHQVKFFIVGFVPQVLIHLDEIPRFFDSEIFFPLLPVAPG